MRALRMLRAYEECEEDLFFFIHIIIKNDINALFIISKQQPQRSSKSKPQSDQQTATLTRLLATSDPNDGK